MYKSKTVTLCSYCELHPNGAGRLAMAIVVPQPLKDTL